MHLGASTELTASRLDQLLHRLVPASSLKDTERSQVHALGIRVLRQTSFGSGDFTRGTGQDMCARLHEASACFGVRVEG